MSGRNRNRRKRFRRQQQQQQPQETADNIDKSPFHEVLEVVDQYKEQMPDKAYIDLTNMLLKIHTKTMKPECDHSDIIETLRRTELENQIFQYSLMHSKNTIQELHQRCLNYKKKMLEGFAEKDLLIKQLRSEVMDKHSDMIHFKKFYEEMRVKTDNPSSKYTCGCGSTIMKSNKTHELTLKHQKYLKSQN